MASGATAAAAAAITGGTLFQYNRKNYMYDRKMRLETEYQIMEFKIKKAELFRDDVRDIIGLTSVKMDTYLIVNAVQLGFCVMMFCEGRLAAGTPNWLIGCHTLALAGAFIYLLMSVWLSMHATIAAKSYEVRLLTQLVRLPVPSWAQLEGARTYASTFEKLESRQMFRVPFATGTQEGVLQCSHGGTAPGDSEQLAEAEDIDPYDPGPMIRDAGDLLEEGHASAGPAHNAAGAFSADPWGLERPGDGIYELDGSVQTDPRDLRHIQLVREAMQYWQSYDAFSRVSMSIGTNQLVTALSYYVLGYVLVSNHAIVAAWLAVVLFTAIACALIRLDMSLTATEYKVAVLMVVCGPLLTSVCTREWAAVGTDTLIRMLMPIVYVSHAGWLVFILYLSKISEQRNGVQLPTGFRSVLYIDVFGWIKDNPVSQIFRGMVQRADRRPAAALRAQERIPAAGPAMQSVRYVDCRPVPMRVDELPDAARAPRNADITRADFAPSTFVPREKEADNELAVDFVGEREVDKAGARPWKVFCGATSLLAVLWWLTGCLVTMELLGLSFLRVTPLTRDSEATIVYGNENSHTNLLQSGQALSTRWPHENIHAFGLACNHLTHTVVASSRFGLYTADIGSSSNGGVQFKAAPLCQDIEGESLQDVSLQCEGDACQAVVLHQQGRKLAKCEVKPSKRIKPRSSGMPSVALIAEEWLNDGDVSKATLPESVQSLAVASKCVGGARSCAYVGTSSERVVEMQQTGDGAVTRKYVPHRLLQAKLNGTSGSSMDVIHGRYLGFLQQDGRHLQVIDLQKGGAAMDSWHIPSAPNKQGWSAMCASGDNLYFFSEGQSPQLWRFAVPQELRPAVPSAVLHQRAVETKGQVLHQRAVSIQKRSLPQAASESGPSSPSPRRKQRTSHVSLHVSHSGDSTDGPPQGASTHTSPELEIPLALVQGAPQSLRR